MSTTTTMDDEDYTVSSELYSEFDYTSDSAPTVNKKNVVSKFVFTYPPEPPEKDSDGDLIVTRKHSCDNKTGFIEIEHSKSTVLDLVGLQIWRGALLLGDWLIHNSNKLPEDSIILELGSGVGLTSVVAAMFKPVICTDINKGEILKLIKGNIARNKTIVKYPVDVKELDFLSQTISKHIAKALPNIKIILAADVVYDDVITSAFIKTVKHLLAKPPSRTVYVALEKRYVFTIADCDTVAPCYEYFLECLNTLTNVTTEEMALDFSQYFRYERVKELVLWKITSLF